DRTSRGPSGPGARRRAPGRPRRTCPRARCKRRPGEGGAMRTTLEPPPGLVGDDTSFAGAGRWRDGSNVRFWLGRAQVIGGWERLSTGVIPGVCRGVFAWTDRDAALNAAFGTHLSLMVWRDELFDATPLLERPAATLAQPFTVADGSASVRLDHAGHGLETGDVVEISGAQPVGRRTPGGAYAVTVVDA